MKTKQFTRQFRFVKVAGFSMPLVIFALLPSPVIAATPQLINYQAAVSGPSGPLDTTVTVIFSIYDGPSSITPLWSETHNSLVISEGRLSVLLGNLTPITDQLFSDTGRYLGIKIGGDSELSPRSRLLSVPYALRLETIDGATGGDVSGALRISPDPAKAEGDALIIEDAGGQTVLSAKVSSLGVAVISLFDPVDSKDGFRLVPVEQVQITPDGILMLDSTGLDTTIIISSATGDITGRGQILVGPGSSGSSTATVFGVNNAASGDTSTITGGAFNIASGDFATVSGGRQNVVTGFMATVGGGYANTSDDMFATVGGGSGSNASGDYSTISGGASGSASGSYSTIGGGLFNNAFGLKTTVGGGDSNTAQGPFSSVFSGFSNTAGDSSTDTAAFVGGGYDNLAADNFATVGGGILNNANEIGSTIGGGGGNTANGVGSTISGGSGNITGAADGSTIGGGFDNSSLGYTSTVSGGTENSANGGYSSVSGGYLDTANGDFSGVASGYSNLAGDATTDTAAFVGGGYENMAIARFATVAGGLFDTASGSYSTIPGGRGNIASSDYAFAAGRLARAVHAGAFVWKDATTTALTSTNLNQFSVRASGGVRIYTHPADSTGVTIGAGASSWTSVSDKSVKKDFREINSDELLQKLSEIPISRWKYIAEESQADHIGPMSQDFYAAFGLGDDNKRISTIDADGVALAAIQELYRQNQKLKLELEELRKLVRELNKK